MVVLKKIKASTLMETLVATVLIVVIFMLASMILNNLFSNTIKNNTRVVEAHLNELQYLHKNNKLELPYQLELDKWNVNVTTFKESTFNYIEFEAVNSETNKTILIVNETE